MATKHKYSDLTIIQVLVGNPVTPEMKIELSKTYNLLDHEIPVNKKLSTTEAQSLLYEVCDYVHAHCSFFCPVFLLNDSSVPMNNDNSNCQFFKSSVGMNLFVKSKLSELNIELTNEDPISIHELAHIASEMILKSNGSFSSIREAGSMLKSKFEIFSEADKTLLVGYTVKYLNNKDISGQFLGYLEGKLNK